MLLVKTYVAPSRIHGFGLIAAAPIKKGTPLWRFDASTDGRIPLAETQPGDLHYGYINPRNPSQLVYCGDDSRWWNFPAGDEKPNAIEGEIDASGEAVIIAARDIVAGEELTIDPATDADTARKLTPAKAA